MSMLTNIVSLFVNLFSRGPTTKLPGCFDLDPIRMSAGLCLKGHLGLASPSSEGVVDVDILVGVEGNGKVVGEVLGLPSLSDYFSPILTVYNITLFLLYSTLEMVMVNCKYILNLVGSLSPVAVLGLIRSVPLVAVLGLGPL